MNEWKITGRTGLTGLLGSPVAHSISPLMHNESFRLLGLDYVYLCFDVGEARLEDAVRGLAACGIRGFNLTMPDKTRMAELADELSPAARLIGHNTDGVGFLRSVKDAGLSVAGQNLTVLGAGGAATAICAQAALDGAASIRIFARPSSRFHARALSLADTICRTTACRAELWDQADTAALKKSLEDSLLLINATSVGMAPDTEHSLIEDMSLLPPSLTVADIIYNPRETRLLRLARESGHKTFNGMYMLLYQGAEAFRLWTGMDMPVDTIRDKYFR